MNLVAALVVLGKLGDSSSKIEEKLPSLFKVLAGLSAVATLIQVK